MNPPIALTIAGSDNSAGAGIQADLKTFAALGAHGLTTVTCVVAEVPGQVAGIEAVSPGLVALQNRLVFEAYPVAAVKTGMLWSAAIIEAVLDTFPAGAGRPWLVVDPVMVASSGDALLQPDAVDLYKRRLIPLASLVTPNVDEARVLLGDGREICDLQGLREAGRELAETYGVPFLMKGGHLRGDEATDLLILPGGGESAHTAPFVQGLDLHGTGCTYSAAVTAALARGESLEAAVATGKKFITRAIAGRHVWNGRVSLDQTQRA